MKKIELAGLDQEIHHEILDNGLEVYLLPYKNKNNYFVSYVSKFGSVDLEFKSDGKYVSVPAGIAHFLEHKIFAQEDDIDPMDFFARSGTDCNASTTYNITKYIIGGTNNLEENLDYLLTFVNRPYFTDENVLKEKGIIIEEVKMYQNDPGWILSGELYKNTFKKHPIRIDIGGTVESVKSITKEDIYTCYNTFYQPSNMILLIGGNFNFDRIVNVIKNNKCLNAKTEKKKIEIKRINEPVEINKAFAEVKVPNVVIPKLSFAIKQSIKEVKKNDRYINNLYINMILTILFGSASTFREEMLKNSKMTALAFDRVTVDDIMIIEFFAETNKPKDLVDKILEHLKEHPITKEDVERCKKVWIASEVLISDNIEATINNIASDIDEIGELIPDKIDIIRKLSYKELERVREKLEYTNTSLVLVDGEKED